MAGVFWSAVTSSLTPVDGEPLFVVLAAANHAIYVNKIEIDIDPNSTADTMTLLELNSYSTIGTGGAAITFIKTISAMDETLQVTGSEQNGAYSPVPTKVASMDMKEIFVSGSSVVRCQWNFASPRCLISGGKGLGIEYVDATVTARPMCKIFGEE